jgi:hypothetical protein
MAEPIIFDDGGSTRIKRLLPGAGIGEMDSLLDVDVLASPAGARGSDHTVNDAFNRVLIVCQDKTGPFTLSFSGFTKVDLSSSLDQQLSAEMAAGKLKITVFSTVSDPIVESKQHKKKRRYVVSNSGPIETVSVDGTLVYDTRPGGTLPAGAARPILYTSVVLT